MIRVEEAKSANNGAKRYNFLHLIACSRVEFVGISYIFATLVSFISGMISLDRFQHTETKARLKWHTATTRLVIQHIIFCLLFSLKFDEN